MHVFRPADATETAECWQLALEHRDGPSVLALTRQNVSAVRKQYAAENRCRRGAYELAPANGNASVSLFAAGSEVEIALAARDAIIAEGHSARVVSIPCFELFEEEDAAYRSAVVGEAPVNVGIEAAVRQGWDSVIGRDGIFIGMHQFGGSAPYGDLYKKFDITAQHAANAALERLRTLR
jgi:transketolase